MGVFLHLAQNSPSPHLAWQPPNDRNWQDLADQCHLDIESDPPRVLYNLDAAGIAQGIEFTPEGDKLFVGSAFANRIEVFDVVGDFELRKNPMFLKTGHGHCSLTLGPTYRE